MRTVFARETGASSYGISDGSILAVWFLARCSGPARAKGGEGVPPTLPGIWEGGVTPTLIERRGGGWGITPLPPNRIFRAVPARMCQKDGVPRFLQEEF